MAAESPRDITQRKCRRCKEYKHRRQFIPNLGTQYVRYYPNCKDCRAKNFYVLPNILDQQVVDGILRPKKREKIKEQHAANRANHMARVGRERLGNEKKKGWAPAMLSLRRCYQHIQKCVIEEGCTEWFEEVHALLMRVKTYINEQKKIEHPPKNNVVVWYDVGEFVDEYRALIKAYPLGKDKCPLQIF